MGAASEPAVVIVEHDGLRHAALDWGGVGEPLVLLHANGFCAGYFDPLAKLLTDDFRVVAVDLRGHGGSDAPPSRVGFAFESMAADVIAVLDGLAIDRCCLLGESLGGGIAIVVDRLRPGLVRHVVCCEAIAFDPSSWTPPPRAVGAGNVMAELARARRAVWPDRETVRARYASGPPFDVLAPEALDAYLRWGFVDRDDGGVELACTPETEATIFETATGPSGAPVAFAHLSAMVGRASVLHGEASDLPRAWFEAQAAAVGTELHTIAGGHFFLDEDTARGVAIVQKVLH